MCKDNKERESQFKQEQEEFRKTQTPKEQPDLSKVEHLEVLDI